MAKHAVPKQKQSKTRSKRRYRTFENAARVRLSGMIQLTPCSNCSEMRRIHHACMACGIYRGRQVIDQQKKMENITKIKA